MNEYDSAVIENLLLKSGWKKGSLEDASLVIINTCAVRKHAEDKALARILSIARENPKRTVGIVGCVAQEKGQSILDEHPEVAFAVGPDSIDQIPAIVEAGGSRKAYLDMEKLDGVGLRAAICNPVKAFVTISRGCSNFCSYCIVPHVRGPHRSRPFEDIIGETRDLVDKGIREITFIGQNVNDYNYGNLEFGDILEKANEIEHLLRIRFVTSHPKDFSNRTLEKIAQLKKVAKSIHLPVQSGSNRILEMMNRRYLREDYLRLVDNIYEKIRDVALTTDIIVGFPTETESDFEKTAKLFEEIGYAAAFAFKYSPRPGTMAEKLPDDIPEKEKIYRLEKIISLIQLHAQKYSDSLVGKIREVLVEGESPKNPGMMHGLDEGTRNVIFNGTLKMVGTIVPVKITSADRWFLLGEAV